MKTYNMRPAVFLGALALASSTRLFACGDEDVLSLDDSNRSHPAYRELRRRLGLEIRLVEDGNPSVLLSCTESGNETTPCCSTEFCSARGLATLLEAGCQAGWSAANLRRGRY